MGALGLTSHSATRFLCNCEQVSPSIHDFSSPITNVAATSLHFLQPLPALLNKLEIGIHPHVVLPLVGAVPALGNHFLRPEKSGGTKHHVLCM